MAFGKPEGNRNLMPIYTDSLNMKTGPKMFWMNSPRIVRMLVSPLLLVLMKRSNLKVLDLSAAKHSADSLPFIDVSLISDKIMLN